MSGSKMERSMPAWHQKDRKNMANGDPESLEKMTYEEAFKELEKVVK